MITRQELVKFIQRQLDNTKVPVPDKHMRNYHDLAWHYGISDLRAVLDLVYGGPPRCAEEELRKVVWTGGKS
jgi:hypothetical protein